MTRDAVWVDIGGDTVVLRSRGHEIRFPRTWGRKFATWLREGTSRNVVCNADVKRFNLLGVTKSPEGLLFTYLEGDTPQVLRLTTEELAPVIPALARED